MNFSLEQLSALVAVYEHGSFSRAANKLGKHRTTIGQVITNLEDQLAIDLFERIGRSVMPTESGQLLYRYAKLTIEQAMSFERMAMSLSHGHLEQINIGYCSFLPNDLIINMRLHLRDRYPNMKVNFLIRTKNQVKRELLEGELHAGLVNIDKRVAVTSFDTVFLIHVSFAVYASENDPLTRTPTDQLLGAMKNNKQLMLSSYYDDEVADKIAVSSDIEVVDDLSLLINFVQEGVGWALLPKLVVSDLKNILRVIELKIPELRDDFRFPISLWLPHSKPMIKIKKEILSVIDNYIKSCTA